MKKYTYSFLAAILASGIAHGAGATAYTTPVGYETTPIFGNVSGGSAGAATLVAPTLVNPAVFSGLTNDVPTGNTAMFSSGVPTGLDGAYMLEIADGASEGWWSTVVSSTATSIESFDAFPSGLSPATKVVVRKFNTVANVFGVTNSANLGPSDFIEILDPATQSTTSVVYAGGWFDLVSEAPAGDYIIYPGTAVRVIVQGSAPLSLVTSGEVKITKTQIDLFQGEAWIGQTFAANGTFGALDLASKILSTDEVLLYSADAGSGQGAESYVASGGAMFNLTSEEESENVIIPDSSGMVVKRPVGSNSTTTLPAQPIGPVVP